MVVFFQFSKVQKFEIILRNFEPPRIRLVREVEHLECYIPTLLPCLKSSWCLETIGISADFQVTMIPIYTERLAEIHFKNRR